MIPRLFEGELPIFSLGTNSGASADPALIECCVNILRESDQSFVVDGRFKGGWITRSFGEPLRGVHALQMELACRGYMREPIGPVSPSDWPTPYDPAYPARTRDTLRTLLQAALAWARRPRS